MQAEAYKFKYGKTPLQANKSKYQSSGYQWTKEINYLKMMLLLELDSVQILISNRYHGLLAQDHISNFIALSECQKSIYKITALVASPKIIKYFK